MIPLAGVALALAAVVPPAAAPGCADAPAPLAAHCEAVAGRPRLPMPTAAERQALLDVYASPGLRRARADPAALRRLIAALWARLLEALGSAEAGRYAGFGRAVFLTAALVAALAGLAGAARRRADRHRRPASPAEGRARLPAPDRSAALADAALARGDLRGAVRHAFLSALAALEESSGLPRDRSLTNRELAGRLHDEAAPLAGPFAALARTFDAAVYGGAPVGEAEARESVELARRLRSRIGAPA